MRATIRGLLVPALLATVSVSMAETPEEIFDRGNAAYADGRYEEAAEALRSLARYRIRDPVLEYNLANAEFRVGRLGWAILHYERARRMSPTDPDIADNLRFARSFCFDRVEAPEQVRIDTDYKTKLYNGLQQSRAVDDAGAAIKKGTTFSSGKEISSFSKYGAVHRRRRSELLVPMRSPPHARHACTRPNLPS